MGELGLTGSAIKEERTTQQNTGAGRLGKKGSSDVRAILNNAIQEATSAALNNVGSGTDQK